mmetsp:Transcript_31656/g.39012  ORF Transcript_31656/g.39012 Transcript_31656/m.39012 type:complete len:416 (+) Transcript_31656:238-1485(+)
MNGYAYGIDGYCINGHGDVNGQLHVNVQGYGYSKRPVPDGSTELLDLLSASEDDSTGPHSPHSIHSNANPENFLHRPGLNAHPVVVKKELQEYQSMNSPGYGGVTDAANVHFNFARSTSNDSSPSFGAHKDLRRSSSSRSNSCTSQDIDAKKKYIAAASRKTRAKRKIERDQMSLRTMELEQEQEEFKKTIAHLQNQIQALKRCRSSFGHIDLSTENRLLRAEVKRHRCFIDQISQIRTSLPKYTREEKLRLAKTGVDSAVGQGLGLAYSSMLSSAWKRVSIPVPKSLLSVIDSEEKIHIRYQYLPHGASRKEAKRVNVRVDVFNVDLSPDSLIDTIWKNYNDPDWGVYMRSIYANRGVESGYEELDGFFNDTEGNAVNANHDSFWDENQYRMKLWRYAEKFKNLEEAKKKYERS